MARPVSAPNRSNKTRAMTMVARRRSASKMFSSARLAFACNSVRGPAPYSHDRQAGLAIVARIGTKQTRATANRLGKHRARVPCTVAARRARAGLGRWARGEQPPPNFQPNARPALDRGPHDLGEPELDRSSLSVTLSGPTLVGVAAACDYADVEAGCGDARAQRPFRRRNSDRRGRSARLPVRH